MSRVLPPDHPQRRPMTLELHARPFPPLAAPCLAVQLAFAPEAGAQRGAEADHAHLQALIDHFGGPRPAEDAQHHFAPLGRGRLKWERHTEFVSYTFFLDDSEPEPFALPIERLAPAEWLAAAPGPLLSAVRVHVARAEGRGGAEATLRERYARFFVAESLAAAHVGPDQATAMGDFRIHEDGFTRFAVLAWPETGERRLGRIVQRLIEIENYRMLSMLALPAARGLSPRLTGVEGELGGLIAGIAEARRDDQATLAELTALSATLEKLQADAAFRFAASGASAALVDQRIEVLKEARAADRQLLSEFMARRFKPAMRTVAATERRLETLAERASRAARLLSARVDVAVENQNRALLESMNRRAEAQLRLQRTVEGLSVVAISYYAVGLVGYVAKPIGAALGIAESVLLAALAPAVAALVWIALRRLRRRLDREAS